MGGLSGGNGPWPSRREGLKNNHCQGELTGLAMLAWTVSGERAFFSRFSSVLLSHFHSTMKIILDYTFFFIFLYSTMPTSLLFPSVSGHFWFHMRIKDLLNWIEDWATNGLLNNPICVVRVYIVQHTDRTMKASELIHHGLKEPPA